MRTGNTMKNNKQFLSPKLRFPEFRGSGGWSATVLGELSEVVRGGSPRPIDDFLTTAVDGLHWLKIGDVDKEAKYVTHTAEKVRQEALSKTRVVNPGDLILSNSMSFGRPYILQIKTCIHDGWIAVTHIAKETERDFLYYLISAPNSQNYFINNAAGSGVQNLNADIIKVLPVCYPTSSEQQKIADCLSSVDELIAAQARKVDALKTHKKGLMQQLFPRESETQPRLRFPEFQNAGEWESKSIGQLGAVVTGSTPSTVQPEYYGGDRLFVSPADISDNRFIEETKTTLTELGFRETRLIKANSILFVCIGSTIGKIAQNRYECATNQQINSVVPNLESANGFVYYVLSGIAEKIANLAGRQAVPIVNKSLFSSVELMTPKLLEQKRIGDCLASLDEVILVHSQKVQALKTISLYTTPCGLNLT